MIDPLALSGRELLQAGMDGHLPPASIAATLNFRLVEIGDGTAVFEGEPGAAHLNPLGSVHGGWALTLIDSACGCAAHSTLDAGVGYTTVETKVNFTRAIRPDAGVLRTEGRVVGRGRTIITAEARIVDAGGRLVAHGTSTLMVLPAR
ncbi:MAG TPA: PaaI family thioesterase [Sphingomonadaceae bacterium]|nr:PaaI family thioesterase [Sphingomonadaceae bacterium]